TSSCPRSPALSCTPAPGPPPAPGVAGRPCSLPWPGSWSSITAVRFAQDADRQATEAIQQHIQALSSQVAAYSQSLPGDPVTAARLAAAAWAIVPTDDARTSMYAVLSQPARGVLSGPSPAWSVTFSP